MDFSNIVQDPNQPKPYTDVLDDYGRAAAQEPAIAKMSVSEFSQRMNDMFGTREYDEGTRDNWLRRLGAAPERGLTHFGGMLPGEKRLFGLPTPSELVGGPPEGINVIKGAGELAERGAKALGAPEWLSGAVGEGAKGFVKTAPTVAAAIAQPELAIPILAGGAGLQTYGETGKALPSVASAVTAGFVPSAMEAGGQAVLGRLGASTVGALKPELKALAEGGSEAARDIIPKYAPSNLLERVGRFTGAQAGMFGASEAGGVAQTLVDPSLTWQQKGQAIAQQFQPSALVGSAISQLPFTAMDVLSERTHPLTRAENLVKADFSKRFVDQALKGDPETNSPPFIPTQDQVAEAMNTVATGQKPSDLVGSVLKSIEGLPDKPYYTIPVITKDEAVPMPQMMGLTRIRAQEVLYARGHDDVLGEGNNQTMASIIRSVEKASEKSPLSKEDFTEQASQAFVDRFEADKLKQSEIGTGATGTPESPTGESASLLRHEQRMADITRRISPTIEVNGEKVANPDYDQAAHQRVALTSGNRAEWEDVGITNPPVYNRGVGSQLAEGRVGGWTGKVRRVVKVPTQMATNIFDMASGRAARIDPEMAREELAQHEGDLADVDARIDQLLGSLPELRGDWTDRQYREVTNLQSERKYIADEIARVKSEMTRSMYPSGGATQVKSAGRFLNEARATQEGVIRAFEYGTTPGDIKAGVSLDLNDPESVAKFIHSVQSAMELGGLAANRQRGAVVLLEPEYNTLKEARVALNELRKESARLQEQGEVPRSYYIEQGEDKQPKTYKSSTDPNKQVYRITAQEYRAMEPILPERTTGAFEEGTVEAGLEAREEGVLPEKPVTLEEQGFDSKALTDNIYTKRFSVLRGMKDRAEAEARSYALANNIAYFLTRMPDAELERLLLHDYVKKEVEPRRRAGEEVKDPSLRKMATVKLRMIRYAQYLRDGGELQVSMNKEGRLVADPEDLAAFDRYMSVVGLGATRYKDTDKQGRGGQPDLRDWNRTEKGLSKAGLNFFEQWAVLMDTMRNYMVDPTAYKDIAEALPRGDFITIPPKFRNEAVGKLYINWGPELEPKGLGTGGQIALTPEAVAAYPEAKGVRLDIRDREGNPVALVSKRNPLIEFFKRSAQQELYIPLNQMLDLFRQYGALDGDNLAMLNLAQKLANVSPFVRDMNVGAAIARDPRYKAYYHSDEVASSAGMLLSPFADYNMFEAGGTYVRQMMKPNDFFPHFMNEIGHAAADFAYLRDGGIRAEVDRIWQHVNDLVDLTGKNTSQLGDFSKGKPHFLSEPREFLASMFNSKELHQLLQKIDDPFEPLPGAPVVPQFAGTLFGRIMNFLRDTFVRLFGIGDVEATTLLNRMSELTNQAVEAQLRMNDLHQAGDIYQQAVARNYLAGRPADVLGPNAPMRALTGGGVGYQPTGLEGPLPEPITVQHLAEQVARSRDEYATNPSQATKDALNNATQMLREALKGVQPPYTWQIRNQESRVADAGHLVDRVQEYAQRFPQLLERAQRGLVIEQQKLNALREKQAAEGGVMLASRLVPEEDGNEIAKPIFNIQGRKGTLLRDPVADNIFTSFVAGNDVHDDFSGSGQTAATAKNKGARRVTLNVFRPDMHSLFDEVMRNPVGLGRRVANTTRLIDAQRTGIPRMRNGSDIKTFLNDLQARDPNLGLYLKQNFNYFGREVGTEGEFTPSPTITNTGLSELPSRIRHLSRSVDNLTNEDGWQRVANARPGEHHIVDPPYVTGQQARYGVGEITPEQRVGEYEKYLYPAAQRGARFLVFDVADPTLMQSLVAHGFTVQPIQRTARVGGVPRQEFIAYNHAQGEMMASKVDPQKALDSMSAAAYIAHEGYDHTWFKPYDMKYFRDTYGPMLGDRLLLAMRGSELGYAVDRDVFNSLTQADLARMPTPRVPTWAPSLFESIRNLYANQGSSPETAHALAAQMLQFGSLVKNSEKAYWGMIGTSKGNTPTTAKSNIAGRAWGWSKVIGMAPESIKGHTPDAVARVIKHESAHTVGFSNDPHPDDLTPDVKAAVSKLDTWFNLLTQGERAEFLTAMGAISDNDLGNTWYYKDASTMPYEFSAEFLGHMGEMITNIPDYSAYIKDQMRFTTDDVANLLNLYSLRRMQGLDKLVDILEQRTKSRGIYAPPWKDMVSQMADSIRPIARSALEISADMAEFFRMRQLYPDMYVQLMNNLSNNLDVWGAKVRASGGTEEPPTLPRGTPPGTILASKDGVVNTLRRWAKMPEPDGNLPDKLGWWDRWLTQFSQFAQKYPIARSAWDMFYNARAMYTSFRTKTSAALAGPYVGNKAQDDVRTKQIHDFQRRKDLREVFNKIALDLNETGDTAFDKELTVKNDVMAMDPEVVTGWLTPEYIQGKLKEYGVADADIPTMMTVLDGTRNQIKTAAETITQSATHRLETTIATGVARNTELPPEASRNTAQLLMNAVKLQETDPLQSEAMLLQFQQTINNDSAFNRLYDVASTGWDGVRKLERFLVLRMPYYMSERRPGQYGLFYRDEDGKITSRYYRTEAELRKAITEKGVDPVRTTFPSDRDYGVSPTVFKQLDEVQARMREKITSLFGSELGPEIAGAMDIAGDLRESLNSRDVLKATTGRDLAPGREELDMFSAHQQYLNAVGRASYNSFIRLESELLNTAAEFRNQPAIKKYINDQVKMILLPDSPIGRQAQNLAFFYYLWGNPSSMIMQTSHQLLGLAPMLTQQGQSIASSYGLILKANKLFMESRRRGAYKDSEIQDAIERARRDGSIGSWLARDMDYGQDLSLVNRMRSTTGKGLWTPFDLLRNKLYAGFDLLRRFYDIVPTYNSEIALVASLLHFKGAKGGNLHGDELFREAQFLRANTMFTGGKENRPGFFQYVPRSAAQSVWSLQTYANGLTTMMGELIRKSVNPKGMTPAQAKQTRYAAAQMLTTQVAVAGVLGLPFAQAILYGLQKLFPEHNLEEDIRDVLASVAGDDEQMGNLISSYLVNGIPSSLPSAPDLGARFALAGTFHVSPYSGVGWEQLVGPSGGILERALQAGQAGLKGDPVGTVQQLMPNGFQRIFTALQQQNEYRTQSGRLLANDLRPEEIVARAIGFRPARVARGEDFERLSRMSEDAEKAEQTEWTKEQVKLLGSGQDATVQRNIADRVQRKGGVYTPVQLSNDVSREYERATMPVDYRDFGNRSTVREQRRLRGVLGTQSEGPSNLERLQLQQSIAQRLGLGGPSRANLRHASRIDQLISMYPHLTNAQATLLLTHAAASRPTPDLYRELLAEY